MSVTVKHLAIDADHGESGGEPRHDLREWLDAAAELARAVNRDLPESELASLIAGTVVHLTGYDFCSVLLPDHDMQHLLIKGSYGLSPGYVARVNAERPPRISPGATAEGPSSRAFRSQRPVVLVDICADPTCLEWEAAASAQGYRAILALPLVGVGGVLGVLSCYCACPREFAAEEVVLMETFANQAALAVEATARRERGAARSAHLCRRIEVLEEEHRVVQRAEGVHRDLMRLLLAGETLERVTEHLARELRSDVLVEDAAGHPLGASRTAQGLDSMRATALRLGHTPLLAQAGDEYRAVELPAREGQAAGLVAPVVLAGELAGRVWAFNMAEPGGVWQRRVLERGASVVALAVSKLRTAQEVEWRLSREFLDDLLTAKPTTDPFATLARAKQLGIDLTVPHTLLVLRPDPLDDGPAVSPASAVRLHRSLLTQVQHVVDASRTEALVAARGADVIVLWPRRDDLAEAAEIAERLRGHCTSCTRGSVSVGLGRACLDVTDYTDAYRLATGALNLTQRAGRHDRVVALGDLGVYRLLLQVERPDELIAFMESMLEPLYTYDARRDTTLVETLRAFLRCGCNATTTAEALIVHPNTISYRLRRIEELLAVDCHDSQALLKFQFAFVIEDVLGAGPGT
ncbi:helix-turn-helix domain-containing protein [Pseudonocardia sp. GCM10023141]|uniref:helix-turn-helix domain-containing protein n=1 Tax=Pseudonocardia sp. GCM10023141 TaxID=3252653 RepID=UPI00361DFD09